MVKNLPACAGRRKKLGSVPGSGRYPGEGQGNPLQYSCLENPMEKGAWWAPVHGITEHRMQLKCSSTLAWLYFMIFKHSHT